MPTAKELQRETALAKANEIRKRRGDLKKQLKAGRADFGDLVYDPPEYLHTAKVVEFLLVLPRYGRARVSKVLRLAGLSTLTSFGSLTDRQRRELLSLMGRR